MMQFLNNYKHNYYLYIFDYNYMEIKNIFRPNISVKNIPKNA